MARTATFKSGERFVLPTGLGGAPEGDASEAPEEHHRAEDLPGVPENNGIDPANAQGTVYEVSDENDGGMLPVSTPEAVIDEVTVPGEDELAYAEAREQDAADRPYIVGEEPEARQPGETSEEPVEPVEEPTEEEEEPEAPTPKESWTHAEIDEWASKQDPPVEFAEGDTKAVKFEKIAAAQEGTD